MIYFFTGWDSDGNLGESYNRNMAMIPNNEDYGCFIDGDAVYTSQDFGDRLERIIKANPQYAVLTCMTNRVGQSYQVVKTMWKNENMSQNRKMGNLLWSKHGTQVDDITNSLEFSGVLILIKKQDWIDIGGFKTKGVLGVDTELHNRVRNHKKLIGLMRGFYVQHWYRYGVQGNTLPFIDEHRLKVDVRKR